MLRLLTVTILLAPLVGCGHLAAHRQADTLQLASADDAACVARGLHYPDPDYVSCRYGLQSARILRQAQCLQMAEKAADPRGGIAPACGYTPDNRPALDHSRFTCWTRSQFGTDYVVCGERGGP